MIGLGKNQEQEMFFFFFFLNAAFKFIFHSTTYFLLATEQHNSKIKSICYKTYHKIYTVEFPSWDIRLWYNREVSVDHIPSFVSPTSKNLNHFSINYEVRLVG
uniref:Uncharacterized protein n=1 Tax=Spongospora subterranea TaxID=70186 RepID=A0A0H5QI01_9EUKA|eukprot:CRZ01603.1 hypothetical protein [Spongospora subterranea]